MSEPMRKPRGNYKPAKGGNQFSTIEMHVFITKTRRANSTHVFVCPICEKRDYVGEDYVAWRNKAQAFIDSFGPSSVEIAGPACEDCYAVMEVHRLNAPSLIERPIEPTEGN